MPGSAEFSYLDTLLFAILPYVAMIVFFVGTIYRYRAQSFSYSSLSSQFLENDRHFWGMVPFHYGLIFVLLGHVIAFLFPLTLIIRDLAADRAVTSAQNQAEALAQSIALRAPGPGTEARWQDQRQEGRSGGGHPCTQEGRSHAGIAV